MYIKLIEAPASIFRASGKHITNPKGQQEPHDSKQPASMRYAPESEHVMPLSLVDRSILILGDAAEGCHTHPAYFWYMNLFEGLNPQQATAVSHLRGPVCILAGAGTGKTTTITRRIANQVATNAFSANQILAVTFTDKAAKEMASRLERLGVGGVRARTFHSEALAQYRRHCTDDSEVMGAKAQILFGLIQRLPMPHKFVAVRDIATEIEWAKNRRVTPAKYLDSLGPHQPPVPPDIMARLYAAYEERKGRANLMDFEDLLNRTIEMLASDNAALEAVRDRYHSITVDEYQDVNLLQQNLLDAWLDMRSDVCVVGDDYQSIFGFTGATPDYLLKFPDKYPDCHVVRLTTNYRSTPQVLRIANMLAPGTSRMLRAEKPDGPAVAVHRFDSGEAEIAFIVTQARDLEAQGIPFEEIAVLFRINGRSEQFEEAFSRAGIPYQVRDSAFLRRPAARAVLARLKKASGAVGPAVESVVTALGYQPDGEFSGDEATRQSDLGRLLELAEEFASGEIPAFMSDLARRFSPDETGRGVQLLTYHRAKGQEFEAVFLPRLEERELPFALAKTDEDLGEERRLLYVGITRAKRHLNISWAALREGERRRNCRPSPFLSELGLEAPQANQRPTPTVAPRREKVAVGPQDQALFTALKGWRLQRCRSDEVPAFVVFSDQTLAALASARPGDFASLLDVPGIGPAKSALYGVEVIEVIQGHP